MRWVGLQKLSLFSKTQQVFWDRFTYQFCEIDLQFTKLMKKYNFFNIKIIICHGNMDQYDSYHNRHTLSQIFLQTFKFTLSNKILFPLHIFDKYFNITIDILFLKCFCKLLNLVHQIKYYFHSTFLTNISILKCKIRLLL